MSQLKSEKKNIQREDSRGVIPTESKLHLFPLGILSVSLAAGLVIVLIYTFIRKKR